MSVLGVWLRRTISIHVPLAGHDAEMESSRTSTVYFNPRAPCGARHSPAFAGIFFAGFQSTCPLRGTTCPDCPPPTLPATISIHVPLAGHDPRRKAVVAAVRHFNPRAPCGARPTSITCYAGEDDFNPRAPCGARHRQYWADIITTIFQSTCPLRGTTSSSSDLTIVRIFQSTCPLRGTTRCSRYQRLKKRDFNPRAPCGARPGKTSRSRSCANFNPRAPCGARRRLLAAPAVDRHFNPRAPCGARRP